MNRASRQTGRPGRAPAKPVGRRAAPGTESKGSPAPQAGSKLYGHRVSLDLSDDVYDRLVRVAFDADRTPHGTITRHVIALALNDPELMERAIALAKADVEAVKAAKRRPTEQSN